MLQCTSMPYHLLFYSISELTLPKKKFLNFIGNKSIMWVSPFFQSSRFYVYTYCFIFLDIFKIPFYHQEFLNLLWILLKYLLWIFIFSAQVFHLHNPRKSLPCDTHLLFDSDGVA